MSSSEVTLMILPDICSTMLDSVRISVSGICTVNIAMVDDVFFDNSKIWQ
jgi:hypothetical protein